MTDIGTSAAATSEAQDASKGEASSFKLKEQPAWRCLECHQEVPTPQPGHCKDKETCEQCGGEIQYQITADYTAHKAKAIDSDFMANQMRNTTELLDHKQAEFCDQYLEASIETEKALAKATKDAEAPVPCPSTPMLGTAPQEDTRVPAPGTPARIATAAPTSPTFQAAQLVPNVAGSSPQPDQQDTQKVKRRTKAFTKSQTTPPESMTTSDPKEPKAKPADDASSSSDKAAKKKRSKKSAR